MPQIATWNINSVRTRLQQLINWLEKHSPAIMLLQEIKCMDELFPFNELENLGYNIAVSGQKSYNGVAILSKYILEDVVTSFKGDPDPAQKRYIEATVSLPSNKALRVASVYIPNGSEIGSDKFIYKMQFLEALQSHVKEVLSSNQAYVLGGDFNIAPEGIDTYDQAKLEGKLHFTLDERQHFRRLLNTGMIDIYRAYNPEAREFSWWDYRAGSWQANHGLRIDHLLCSPEAADMTSASYIDSSPRGGESPSDHTPVVMDYSY
jgi:exodeoxyribonuclease-3